MNKQVFVIEDDEDLLQILKYNLEKEGYTLHTARDGLRALWEMGKKERPDCILLDLMMPSPNGFEVCDYLKSSEDYREIPLIIISAKNSGEDIEKALELGADAYLPKPFSLDNLLHIVKKYSSAPRGEIRYLD